MKLNNRPQENEFYAWLHGTIGMVFFAGSLPATRLALQGFDPFFLTAVRILLAGILAGLILFFTGEKWPTARNCKRMIGVIAGVVIGFPLLTALALQYVPSSHALIFIALLPLTTSAMAVFLPGGKEQPKMPFWIFASLGSLIVMGYGIYRAEGNLALGDIYMILAILVGSLGYAEGGKLAKELGGVKVISWALVMGGPCFLPIMWIYWPDNFSHASLSSWGALVYVALFSQLIGFFFWYKGLAQGGIARISQLQLIQPLLGIMLSAIILQEIIEPILLTVAFATISCVWMGRRFA